ncbi:MAG: hypothetical protein UU77_C0018G0011 [candidate division WWE3 bacterium GW2011_GWC1_41_7]|uniref:Uncharacterized protein n=4 Tax=Katanobacteria TaxID=422282 RepID=A0A0G0ZFB9_UNCKA|nr:MAG: hypothetical protein UU72_C0001G0109 [candidate division WWE3 bacterium GW2011_GWB1_41_6]KKS20736.1 MAG: hypothetical protein UU77_C0018G0011 [candidate division WWE3 bacterium GW2011_GWC1_41_7]KKS22839.1 MAG: hypothetical protein UU80_C0001G0004 [candidate division WWE3 bacterium GW2011_GWA1_41_8]OGC56473.1 MAG: hypothetical protein A2976_01250 [candidate division WWE3 bacterium RIFCSPLOWO2_01_FULL_41_9]
MNKKRSFILIFLVVPFILVVYALQSPFQLLNTVSFAKAAAEHPFSPVSDKPVVVPLAEAFSAHASDPFCDKIEDGITSTSRTVRCLFDIGGDVIVVDYDEWVSEETWKNIIYGMRKKGKILQGGKWESGAEISGNHGPYIAWLTENNKVAVMWGVYEQRLTGILYWYDDSTDDAVAWFIEQTSTHRVP